MVNSTKFLGDHDIDDKLKWTAHIQYIKNTLSKSIGIMYKCRSYFDYGMVWYGNNLFDITETHNT